GQPRCPLRRVTGHPLPSKRDRSRFVREGRSPSTRRNRSLGPSCSLRLSRKVLRGEPRSKDPDRHRSKKSDLEWRARRDRRREPNDRHLLRLRHHLTRCKPILRPLDLQERLTWRKGERLQRLRPVDDTEDFGGTGLFQSIARRFLVVAPPIGKSDTNRIDSHTTDPSRTVSPTTRYPFTLKTSSNRCRSAFCRTPQCSPAIAIIQILVPAVTKHEISLPW